MKTFQLMETFQFSLITHYSFHGEHQQHTQKMLQEIAGYCNHLKQLVAVRGYRGCIYRLQHYIKAYIDENGRTLYIHSNC